MKTTIRRSARPEDKIDGDVDLEQNLLEIDKRTLSILGTGEPNPAMSGLHPYAFSGPHPPLPSRSRCPVVIGNGPNCSSFRIILEEIL